MGCHNLYEKKLLGIFHSLWFLNFCMKVNLALNEIYKQGLKTKNTFTSLGFLETFWSFSSFFLKWLYLSWNSNTSTRVFKATVAQCSRDYSPFQLLKVATSFMLTCKFHLIMTKSISLCCTGNLSNFKQLWKISKQLPGSVLQKRCSYKFCEICRKALVPESPVDGWISGGCL